MNRQRQAQSSAASASADHAAAPAPTWFTPHQAADHLGVDLLALRSAVESGSLPAFLSLDSGLRFRHDHLDALMLPVSPTAALRQLTVDSPPGVINPMTTTSPTTSVTSPLVPLKQAARQLNTPYKTLLRLIHVGTIPATNLGTSARSRYFVDVAEVQRRWAKQAELDMRKRSAPVPRIDFARMLRKHDELTGEASDG